MKKKWIVLLIAIILLIGCGTPPQSEESDDVRILTLFTIDGEVIKRIEVCDFYVSFASLNWQKCNSEKWSKAGKNNPWLLEDE